MKPFTSTADELESLGWKLSAHQYQVVHLAARYDDELEWFHQGLKSAAFGIANRLQLHTSTAHEWIRIGHALKELPLVDEAFRGREISYAKVRILTRWAEPGNEDRLLHLATTHAANGLTRAIASQLADDESEEQRDQRHHEARSVTHYTDGDGMVVVRIVLPPSIAKMLIAMIEALVQRIAALPARTTATTSEQCPESSADDSSRRSVIGSPLLTTQSGRHSSADDSDAPLFAAVAELEHRWQPASDDHRPFPTLAQQRADAFALLVLGFEVDVKTEVVVHVRGDGCTYDDGTPLSANAVGRQLDGSFIRLLIHNAERQPINASSRRRYPTTRQKRVVMETHNHECVDCASTELLELDHNPPYWFTQHTITAELEPRCAPCHRARHRTAA